MKTASRRFLVVVRAGSKSLHPSWLGEAGTSRNWDLQLSTYGDNAESLGQADLPTVVDQGTKWDSMARHFQARPELLDRYEYIMLADDDLLMRPEDINGMFERSAQYKLSVSQMSLSRDSWITYPVVMQCPKFAMRYTNHIDCMSPCFESGYLRSTVLPLVEKYICGWGADHVWAMLMENPAYRCAVFDDIAMVHTRPLGTGTLQGAFARLGADPVVEVRTVTGLFDNYPGVDIPYAGVLPNGERVGSSRVQLINGLYLIVSSLRTKTPYKVFRKGVGILLQTFSRSGYVPEQLFLRASESAPVHVAQPVAPAHHRSSPVLL